MQVSSSTEQGLGALAMDFALGEQLSTKCSFLPLTFLFSSAPGPQATMDAHLGGQESASKSSKGSSSTGDQQGHYPCVKSSNWDVCLILDGMAVSPPSPPQPPTPRHLPHKELSLGLFQKGTVTNNLCTASPGSQ